MEQERLKGLHIAAMVHDIGQIQIPSEIMNRSRKLTVEEMDLVKMHAEAGYEILKDIRFPWPIAEMVYQHHENVDGSGYPRGLKGEQLLPEAKIIRVCDSLNAMQSHRPFRGAYDQEGILAQLELGRGTYYDPEVLDVVLGMLRNRQLSWFTGGRKE